jgi:hypothetical protein
MHNLVQFFFRSVLFVLLLTGAVYADEYMDKTRVNFKEIVYKSCNQGAKGSATYSGMNTDTLCTCTSEGTVSSMSDADIKDVFLSKNGDKFKASMMDAMAGCMAEDPSSRAFFKQRFYEGCIRKQDAEFKKTGMNQSSYCECTAENLVKDLSKADVQDLIKIGMNPNVMSDTKVSDKMISVATDCVNKMMK